MKLVSQTSLNKINNQQLEGSFLKNQDISRSSQQSNYKSAKANVVLSTQVISPSSRTKKTIIFSSKGNQKQRISRVSSPIEKKVPKRIIKSNNINSYHKCLLLK